MILEGCQGKPRTPEILEKVCPQCGSEIELFTCDTQAVCEHCGFVVYNDTHAQGFRTQSGLQQYFQIQSVIPALSGFPLGIETGAYD